jgi:hypothetical protein
MSYFNHSYHKAFVGTKASQGATPGVDAGVADGFLITSGVHSNDLKNTAAPFALGVGTYGFFDPTTNLSVIAADAAVTAGKPLILACASLMTQDKIGQFHGGYTESNKSKMINPRYINKLYKVEAAAPESMIVHVGNTNFQDDCTFDFLCGEDYTINIKLFGAPVLAYLNRDSYRHLAAYTGCCADAIAPDAVNSMIVFTQWANEIMTSPYLKDFVSVVLYDELGAPWFYDAAAAVAAGWPATQIWSLYDLTIAHIPNALGGMAVTGAYVGTTFSDCTFQVMDHEEKDIVQIEIQMVDQNGDPCVFEGLCVETECCGYKGEGYRNTVLKEVILHESYLQNYLSCDLRIREVTLGTQIINAVPAGNLYTRYCIQHVVPRMSNPSGTFDNDQYTLTIYIPTASALAFEAFMVAWLAAANNPVDLQTFTHVACVPTALPVFAP